MAARPQYDSIDDEDDETSGGGLDAEVLKSYLTFAGRALRSRLLLAALLFVGAVAMSIGLLSVLPKRYYAEVRMMAQSAGGLSDGAEDLSKTFSSAAAVILRHDNIKAIVKQTQLARHWDAGRAPLHRFKDALMRAIRGELPEEAKNAVLANMLQGKYYIDDSYGILTIGATWTDPQIAVQLVEAARQNFLEARHLSEISLLAENISILEGHAAQVRNEVYELAEHIKKLREETREQHQDKLEEKVADESEKAAKPTQRVVVRSVPAAPVENEELSRVKVMLEAKQRALKELEAQRIGVIRELKGQLSELLLTYTEAHPRVVHVKMKIEAQSKESAQVSELRSEVKELEARAKQLSAVPTSTTTTKTIVRQAGGESPAPTSRQVSTELRGLLQDGAGDIDPTVLAQSELAMGRYSDLQGRISSARLELDRAQAAFKHRYKIMSPAVVPSAPSAPNSMIILLGGIAAGLLLAVVVPLVAELRTGKIVARWQVSQLPVPILADLRLPPGPQV